MDAKDIATILLKTAGLVMFAYAIFDIPYYFPPYVTSGGEQSFINAWMQAAAVVTLPIVLGLVLWFFPATVVNKIVAGPKLTEGLQIHHFERVALTVLGVWLVAYGIVDVIHYVTSFFSVRQQFPDFPGSRFWLGILTPAAKLLVGAGMAIGAKGVVRLIARVRREA
jgi:hypothetical protein